MTERQRAYLDFQQRFAAMTDEQKTESDNDGTSENGDALWCAMNESEREELRFVMDSLPL